MGFWRKGAHVDSNSLWRARFYICQLPSPDVCYSDYFRSKKDGVQRIDHLLPSLLHMACCVLLEKVSLLCSSVPWWSHALLPHVVHDKHMCSIRCHDTLTLYPGLRHHLFMTFQIYSGGPLLGDWSLHGSLVLVTISGIKKLLCIANCLPSLPSLRRVYLHHSPLDCIQLLLLIYLIRAAIYWVATMCQTWC